MLLLLEDLAARADIEGLAERPARAARGVPELDFGFEGRDQAADLGLLEPDAGIGNAEADDAVDPAGPGVRKLHFSAKVEPFPFAIESFLGPVLSLIKLLHIHHVKLPDRGQVIRDQLKGA